MDHMRDSARAPGCGRLAAGMRAGMPKLCCGVIHCIGTAQRCCTTQKASYEDGGCMSRVACEADVRVLCCAVMYLPSSQPPY